MVRGRKLRQMGPALRKRCWEELDDILEEQHRWVLWCLFKSAVSVCQEGHRALLEELDDCDIPVEWGGKCTTPLYERPHELELAAFVARLNGGGGGAS
jgi:hypothetical protein